MTKKIKTRMIDGKALYIPIGIYQLVEPLENPYCDGGFWPEDARFVVGRHVDKIGDQNAYEHYSIRLVGSKRYLVKSYQYASWNTFASRFRLVTDDINGYVSFGEIPPLSVLDQL